jgi:hypothetical protein
MSANPAPLPPAKTPPASAVTAPAPARVGPPAAELTIALQEEVAKLVISGQRSAASPPRAEIGGKIFYVGDRVTDSLILQEVQSDHLVFRDDRGHLYVK